MLIQLGHPQPPTPIKIDNKTATNIIHNNITQKRSKSWDMCYYWLRDQQAQNNFNFYWDRSEKNHADYWTKHFTALYHRLIRATYVLDKVQNVSVASNISMRRSIQQGCVSMGYTCPVQSDVSTHLRVGEENRSPCRVVINNCKIVFL